LLIDFTFNFNDEGITAFEELSCLWYILASFIYQQIACLKSMQKQIEWWTLAWVSCEGFIADGLLCIFNTLVFWWKFCKTIMVQAVTAFEFVIWCLLANI
jgi:hypothetical protein